MRLNLLRILQWLRQGAEAKALTELWPHVPLARGQEVSLNKALAQACHNLGVYCQKRADLEKALILYENAVSLDSTAHPSWFNLGMLCEKLGKMQKAQHALRKAAELNPAWLPGRLGLVSFLARQKDWSTAKSAIATLLKEMPELPEAYLAEANLYTLQGQLTEAWQAYEAILQRWPKHAGAWNNLGLLALQKALPDRACQYLEQAVLADPHFAEAWSNLGEVYLQQNRLQEAEQALEQAQQLEPTRAETYAAIARLAQTQGNRQLAKQAALEALAYAPGLKAPLLQLVWLYFGDRQLDKITQLLQSQPEILLQDAEVALSLARIQSLELNPQKAAIYYSQALHLKPDNRLWQLMAALPGPSDQLFTSQEEIISWQEAFQQAVDQFEPGTLEWTAYFKDLMHFPQETCWGLLYQGHWPRALKQNYTRLFSAQSAVIPETKNSERLRIGFLVTWKHEGIFLKLQGGLLSRLNPELFEIWLIGPQNSKQELLNRLQAPWIHYLPLSPYFEENCRAIRALQLNLLIYWEIGSDNKNFVLPFFRLAQVQATTWGNPVSSTLPEIDYYISSQWIETDTSAEDYTEKLACLEFLPSYYADPSSFISAPRSASSSQPREHRYLCAQNLLKFHPDFDPLLEEILTRDPQGQLLLFTGTNENVSKRLYTRWNQRFPQLMSRIHWLQPMPRHEFVQVMASADVLLDTLHCSGCNTSYEALAFGIPIVTLPGKTARSRLSDGLYRQLGLPHLSARNEQDYVEKALQWGTHKELRQSLKMEILSRKHLIFEPAAVIPAYEQLLQRLACRQL